MSLEIAVVPGINSTKYSILSSPIPSTLRVLIPRTLCRERERELELARQVFPRIYRNIVRSRTHSISQIFRSSDRGVRRQHRARAHCGYCGDKQHGSYLVAVPAENRRLSDGTSGLLDEGQRDHASCTPSARSAGHPRPLRTTIDQRFPLFR